MQNGRRQSQIGARETQAVWLGVVLFIVIVAVAGMGRWNMDSSLQKTAAQQLEKDTEETVHKQSEIEDRLARVEKALSAIMDQNMDAHPSEISPHRVGATFWRLVESKIDEKLTIAAADSVGVADYALASAGGRIVGHSKLLDTVRVFPNHPFLSNMHWIASAFCRMLGIAIVHPRATEILLQPLVQPGNCLPLDGFSGEVDIKLRAPIVVSAVTLEHIPKSIAYSEQWTSAPREILIQGYTKSSSWGAQKEEMVALGQGEFDREGRHVQTFSTHSNANVSHVRLQVLSNHGHPGYTCLYRIRVHGSPF